MQKFTQLKEEIISSKTNDELFMLTKEMKHASEKYLLVRKAIWKVIIISSNYSFVICYRRLFNDAI